MRLSELIGRPVEDRNGVILGQVLEVVLTHGPSRSRKPFAGLRVEGVVVARHGYGLHWGFDNDRHLGPFFLRALLTRRRSAALYIPWSDLRKADRASGTTLHATVAREHLRTFHDAKQALG